MELFHSRPVAPTRRVALGHLRLPTDPAPGVGGLLLGAVVAANMAELDPEYFDELDVLARTIEIGQRIAQPQLRHRLQIDRVGLQRSHHRLVADGEQIRFELDDWGTPAQNVLGAVYAAGRMVTGPRTKVVATIRKAMRWSGAIDHSLVAHLTGVRQGHAWSFDAHRDPITWALGVLGLRSGHDLVGERPARRLVQQRFRELLRQAHPDHGGESGTAATRIAELDEARRILLTT
jgi:hypothetical protein